VQSTAVPEVEDKRQVGSVVGQLVVAHPGEGATVDVARRPVAQRALRYFQLLHQLLKLLDGELAHVTVGRHRERLCTARHTMR